ncbi:MAG TPA: hypothetical protein VFS08_03680 [Gemmatimonadaceae bacterium]|nr:hypothetical protein [Gemmatimonadaceae bacterium]
MLRLILRVQGALYLLTGLWPLVHLPSFELVTGPKTDDWLVKTVGLLTAAIGATLWAAAWAPRPPHPAHPAGPLVFLGAATAASFAAVDLVYALGGRISAVYLLDAALELALLLALALGWWRARGEG